jgi:predicted  nucleic acid-binding Zn-ribbon protein
MGRSMLRNVVLSVATLVLGLTLSVTAAASSSATQCDAVLGDVEVARESLAQLEHSLVDMDLEQGELLGDIAGLEQQIVDAQAKGRSIMALRADLDALKAEVALIEDLRPELVAQRDALRTTVDAGERSYIACVESVVGH